MKTLKQLQEQLAESVVPDDQRGKQKPYVSSDGKGNFEVLGNKGQTKQTFTRKEHGAMARDKAREHLKSKYDEYMNEGTVPFDGPYTKVKPTKNSDGTVQSPMSKARELARQALKKQMKEEFDLDITDEEIEQIVEVAKVRSWRHDKEQPISHARTRYADTPEKRDQLAKDIKANRKHNVGKIGTSSATVRRNAKGTTASQRTVRVGPDGVQLRTYRGIAKKAAAKEVKEEILDEMRINGREYASQGVMHPDHAKMNIHQPSNQHVDFYASGTGDKMQGKVTKNDGKSVHIQAHKELGDGKLHKFKVTPNLPKPTNEEKDMKEELKGDQHKIDANKNGKLDKFDFAKLRARRKQMQEQQVDEKMDLAKYDMGDVVKDFQKSDAPQFDGKSDKKRQQMAVAAKLEADRKSMKEEFQGFSSFLKIHEDIAEEIIEEGMISYGDFNDKMAAHKKAGNRILDYKHGEKSAHYVVVDKEGTKRKVTYTDKGQKMENMGGSTDKEKPAAPAEKRGRGRPKGSASGARLKGSAKDNDDDSGLDDTRYSVHLPSGRR
jgi:hypothetical protein